MVNLAQIQFHPPALQFLPQPPLHPLMKLSLLLATLALCGMSFAASSTELSGISSAVSTELSTPSLDSDEAVLASPNSELSMVSADGISEPVKPVLLSNSTATAVPESAGAALVAAFGYVLMLRRRTA